PCRFRSTNNWPCTPTPTSSPACLAPGASAPPDCLPRSVTAAPASPHRNRWPVWPAWHPLPDNPARSVALDSAGLATNNCATPLPTSPVTPDGPTPGPPTSTIAPSPAATTTPTPYASGPVRGSTSSGTAGKTTPPTTPTNTEHCNASSKAETTQRLDTGLLMGRRPRVVARPAPRRSARVHTPSSQRWSCSHLYWRGPRRPRRRAPLAGDRW